MPRIEKRTRHYPSDMTDEECNAVEPLPPGAARKGVKRTNDLREVRNAIRYMAPTTGPALLDFVIEVVRRTDTDPGFNVIPRRCVVERRFGWPTPYRRLARDDEARIDVFDVTIYVAMGTPLVGRIVH